MKFRNPETGEIFDTIIEALERYCQDHPQELLILMNYDEVEDEPSGNPGKLKEANMDKPRICEILGVEPGESFYIRGLEGIEFWIMDDGTFSTRPSNVPGSTKALLLTLDHPERIIRKPRFTQQEVEDAKTIKRMFGSGNFSHFTHIQKDEMGRPAMVDCPMGDDGRFLVGLAEGMFPSIRPGQSYTLDEIIGGAE